MVPVGLTHFWIVPPSQNGPIGFGVTAHSLDDALQIIQVMGFGMYLPIDLNSLDIIEGVTVDQLDQCNVVPRMGPIVTRGMWYPFLVVGVPAWAKIIPN